MKQLIFCFYLLVNTLACPAQPNNKQMPGDGFYLVDTLVKSPGSLSLPNAHQYVLPCSSSLKAEGYTQARIELNNYVPLALQAEPQLIKGLGGKSRLQLTLSPKAAAGMEALSRKGLGRQAAVVVNGQVLSAQKIRAVISTGRLEISGCEETDCNALITALKAYVKK